MKKSLYPVVLLCALLIQTGCFSIGSSRKSPMPRYALLAERPVPQVMVREHSPTNVLFGIGRIKSSRATEGNTIPLLDSDSGRYGTYDKAALAFPVDVIVDSATRNWLARSDKFGTVVDASIAPRSKHRKILECWIEQFGLERDHGKWTSKIDLRYILQYPDGNFREIPVNVSTDVDTPVRNREPETADVLRALRIGLENGLEKLENELEKD